MHRIYQMIVDAYENNEKKYHINCIVCIFLNGMQ